MSGRRTRQRQQPGRDGHAEEDRTHDNNRPDVDPPHPDPHPADGNVLLEIVDIEELEEEEEDDYDDSEQDFDTEDELVDIEGDFSDEDYRGREPATIHHVRRQRGDPLQVQYIDIEIPLAFFGRGIGTQQASQGSQGSAAPRPVFTMQGMFGSGGVRGVTTRVQPGQGAEQHSGATGTSATAAPAPAPASRYELRDRASRPAPRYQFRTRRPAAAQPSRSINTPIFLPGNPHEPIVVRGRDDRGATFRLPGANENLFVPRVNQDNYAEVLANVLFHVMMASGHGPGGGMPHLQGQPPASETARRALPSLGVELERGRALKCPSCSICMEEFAIEGNVTKETSSSLSSASTSRPLNQSNSQGQAQSSASTTLPPSLPSQTIRAMPCHHLFHEDCLFRWLTQSNQCPSCRYEIMTDSADYNRSVGTRMAPRDEALRLEAMAESELDISTDPPPRKRRKLNGNREERSEEERNVPSAPPASNSNVRDYALRPRRAEQ